MVCPYIHKRGQNDGVIRLADRLLAESAVLDLHFSLLLLFGLGHKLRRRFQWEVELFLKQLHAVHFQGYLVALCPHGGGEIVLHLIHKRLLLFSELAGDLRQRLRGNIVGRSLHGIKFQRYTKFCFDSNLRGLIEDDASALKVIQRLLTFGIGVKAHDLLKVQVEVHAGG